MKAKEKKPAKPSLLRGLATLGAGGALLASAHNAMSAEDIKKLQPFLDLTSKWNKAKVNDVQKLQDYIETASQAATAKPFGKPVVEVMKDIRSGPWMDLPIMPRALKNYKWDSEKPDDALRYTEFAKGPVSAYKRYFTEHFEDKSPWINAQMGDDNASELIKNLPEQIHEYAKQQDINLDTLSPVQQMDFLKSFDAALGMQTPLTAKAKELLDTTMGESSAYNAKIYGGVGHLFKGITHDLPMYAGYGLGAAGTGLLARYLYKKFHKTPGAKKSHKAGVLARLLHRHGISA